MLLRNRPASIYLLAPVLLLLFLLYRHSQISAPIALKVLGAGSTVDSLVPANSPAAKYPPGIPKLHGGNYTRTIVIGKLQKEDIGWLYDSGLGQITALYVVDNPSLSPGYEIPKNKGHEAMVYLSYIIDYYDHLSDITIFLHPHLITWHNNDLLDSNAYTTIQHMIPEHIIRQGYFNTRCHHEPGCPDWLHLDRPKGELDSGRKMEEESFSTEVWNQLHPGVPPPYAISQPCCAQFAVTKERIRANPREQYIFWRDWLLNTELEDSLSGRIFEYSWQYIFTGLPEVCPAMNVCYCEGYGICFGSARRFSNWFDERKRMKDMFEHANGISSDPRRQEEVKSIRDRAHEIDKQLEVLKAEAFVRGRKSANRAKEGGRA